MQRNHLVVALPALTLMLFICGCHAAAAAELAIPPRIAPKEISIRTGPPNCSRWTDDCVNCTRGAKDEPATCSNIGIACQPKAIRCLGTQ